MLITFNVHCANSSVMTIFSSADEDDRAFCYIMYANVARITVIGLTFVSILLCFSYRRSLPTRDPEIVETIPEVLMFYLDPAKSVVVVRGTHSQVPSMHSAASISRQLVSPTSRYRMR